MSKGKQTKKNVKMELTIDDTIEGVFLIEAKTEETFHNRRRKLEELTGFTTDNFDAYEEDEDGGVWKVITTAHFNNVDEIKKALEKMRRHKWLYLLDSTLLLEGKELYCDGRWIIKETNSNEISTKITDNSKL